MAQHKYKVGDKVLVGRHTTNSGANKTYWSDLMDPYVGKEAVISYTELHTGSDPDHLHYKIDIDEHRFSWREEALTLIGTSTAAPIKVEYGAKCSKCGDYNEFAENKPGFTCYGCRH